MLTTMPIREMITIKTVHARASSAERFHVICPETKFTKGFVTRNPVIAGIVKQSDPKNRIFCPNRRLAPSIMKPRIKSMARDTGHEGATKKNLESRSIFTSPLTIPMHAPRDPVSSGGIPMLYFPLGTRGPK